MKRNRNEIIYTDAETYTPEEESITAEQSTFAGAGGEIGKKKKSSSKSTLTVIIAMLCLAAVVLLGYFIFLYEPEIGTEVAEEYKITAEAKDTLEGQSVTIYFKASEIDLTRHGVGSHMYKYVLGLETENGLDVDIEYSASVDADIVIEIGGEKASASFADLSKSHEDGTPYAYAFEHFLAKTACLASGKDLVDVPEWRALPGYDTDGDFVENGRPLMFVHLTRENVQSITVKNQTSTYKVVRKENSTSFGIEGAEGVDLEPTAFSGLVVATTYSITYGKVSDPKDFSAYGLEGDGATAKVTLVTTDGDTHTVIVGDKDASGGYYYARYDGKDFVYLLSSADVEATFCLGGEKFLTPTLVYPIKDTNDIYTIDKMAIFYRDQDTSLAIRLRDVVDFDSNTATSDKNKDPITIFSDLKRATAYTDWRTDANFIGLGTKDGETFKFIMSLNRISENGKYSIKLPFMRDEAKGAYLPESIEIRVKTQDSDSFNIVEISGEDSIFSQKDGTYQQHVINFTCDEPVEYIRIDMEGYDTKKLFVTDEIRIMAGDVDANPADAFVGNWMITTEEYIPDGRNYAYVNTNAYVDYLTSVTALVADEVVKFGVKDMDLAAYGLAKDKDGNGKDAAIQIYYEFDGMVSTILLSDPLPDGSRYAASMISGKDDDGKEIDFLNPYIAKVSLETAPWMDWEPLRFVSDSLLYMYIDDVEELKFTFDGEEYKFEIAKDDNGKAVSATCNGVDVDMDQFRKFYISLINISRVGEFEAGDDAGSEMLRINLKSETKSDEIIFYRVTSTKAYYTIDGAGGYYTLTYEVSQMRDNLHKLLAGETIK